jgi:hypothetical protein
MTLKSTVTLHLFLPTLSKTRLKFEISKRYHVIDPHSTFNYSRR